MYIQLTTRCNMTCDHCCFNCTHEGEDMEEHVFRYAMDVCRDYGYESIAFGGGEPTLHPLFFKFLRIAIMEYDFNVWLATNGSQKNSMLRLARIMNEEDWFTFEDQWPEDGYALELELQVINLSREFQLQVELSTDYWHDYDMVDPQVRDMWTSRSQRHGASSFGLRDVSPRGAMKAGRAIETGVWSIDQNACCGGIMVIPRGAIRACACDDAPYYGTVVYPEIPEWVDSVECWKSDEQKERHEAWEAESK